MTNRMRSLILGTTVLAGACLLRAQPATTRPGEEPGRAVGPVVAPVKLDSQPASAPAPTSLSSDQATQPTTAPGATTASAPTTTSIAVVRWHGDFESAAQDARRRNVPLVVVFFDPDSPTSLSYDELVLTQLSVRQFLADYAAARINATTGDGLKRFTATGQAEAPVTQFYAPSGELLDSIPGAVVPGAALQEAVLRAGRYWEAANASPATPATRYAAVQARLALSTRAKAVADIDELAKLKPEQFPAGATPGRLEVARGVALYSSSPQQAEESFQKAVKLEPDDPLSGGKATLQLGNLAGARKQYARAHELYEQYIARFPKGADIGEAYYNKAVLEMLPLDDRAAADKTLAEFAAKHPDNPLVVRAKELQKAIRATTSKAKP